MDVKSIRSTLSPPPPPVFCNILTLASPQILGTLSGGWPGISLLTREASWLKAHQQNTNSPVKNGRMQHSYIG